VTARIDLDQFLALADAGATVPQLCAASGLKPTRVYALLREHRPGRPRKPRRRTSDVPMKIRGLVATGIKPTRVAFLLGITPAYVYKVLGERPAP